MLKFSHTSLTRLLTVDIRLQVIANMAIQISRVDFGIPTTGGYRPKEVQHQLYEEGKSQCDGYKKLSKHQTGLALDFYAYVDGKASWDEHHLAMVGAAFLQAASELGYKLSWGGLWKNFPDYPHVQLEE